MTRRLLLLTLVLCGGCQRETWNEWPVGDEVTAALPCSKDEIKLGDEPQYSVVKCAKPGAGLFVAKRYLRPLESMPAAVAYAQLKTTYDRVDAEKRQTRKWLNTDGPLESAWTAEDLSVRQRVLLAGRTFYVLETWLGSEPASRQLEAEFFKRVRINAK